MTKEDLFQAAATIASGIISRYTSVINPKDETEIVEMANRMARELLRRVSKD